jgi:glutamate--cysteine ligase
LSHPLQTYLGTLGQAPGLAALAAIAHGVEKESLRIDPQGQLAQSLHPAGLGSALTHACITTDFSEALMEFITPVFSNPQDSVRFLSDVHTYTFRQLPREELLWTSSMPCVIPDNDKIPLAFYGSSNTAQLKTLYRKGLGYRYGRTMQTIAGIHYNFSLSDAFWQLLQEQQGNTEAFEDFRTAQYFALIRNFRRYSWLLLYLFGASPALCKSFVRNNPNHRLDTFDDASLYLPYATSLRMGDLGYTSVAQAGLAISYNSLQEYADGLTKAIHTPYVPYASFTTADGSPAQVNSNILQMEAEFYSTIRPKRIPAAGERPVQALRRQGVEYIEVRCLDLNPFLPVGIDEETMRFLNGFLVYCVLQPSAAASLTDHVEIQDNHNAVVRRGREPGLQLQNNGKRVTLTEWATSILQDVGLIADLLDRANASTAHRSANNAQLAKVRDSSLTPSARVLERMRELKTSYFRFAMNQSLANSDYFRGLQLPAAKLEEFEQMSLSSDQKRAAIERSDTMDFAAYLQQVNNS